MKDGDCCSTGTCNAIEDAEGAGAGLARAGARGLPLRSARSRRGRGGSGRSRRSSAQLLAPSAPRATPTPGCTWLGRRGQSSGRTALAAWRGEDQASDDTLCHAAELTLAHRGDLPPQAEAGWVPVLWYLSGLTCTHENAMVKAGAQAWAAQAGIAVVFPDTSPRGEAADDAAFDLGRGAGFYVDATEAPWAAHFKMWTYVAEELPELVFSSFALDAERQAITGHSMGGHLVLRAVAERAVTPAALVLSAPMLGFVSPFPQGLQHFVARIMCRIGNPARMAWPVSEKPGSPLDKRATDFRTGLAPAQVTVFDAHAHIGA